MNHQHVRTVLGTARSLILLSCIASAVTAAQEPLLKQQPEETVPAFKANQTYTAGDYDDVQVYSGALGITIPLGPSYSVGPDFTFQLRAVYGSKLWHMFNEPCGSSSDCGGTANHASRGHLSGASTLGAGWSLPLGFIEWDATKSKGTFHSPGGARHAFIGAGPLFYSEDVRAGLRITNNGTWWKVEQPDGSYLELRQPYVPAPPANGFDFSDENTPSGRTRYGVTGIYDRFGSKVVTLTYDVLDGNGDRRWQIKTIQLGTDVDRTITFTWENIAISGSSNTWRVLDHVDFNVLKKDGSHQTLRADFTWTNGMLRRAFTSGPDSGCSAPGPLDFQAPFLDRIDLKPGSGAPLRSFDFGYSLGTGLNGVLTRFVLPTGGEIDYTYSDTTVPAACIIGTPGCTLYGSSTAQAPESPTEDVCGKAIHQAQRFLDQSPAVIQRTATSGLYTSTTTYSRKQLSEEDPGSTPGNRWPDEERTVRRVTVTRPDGEGGSLDTVSFFAMVLPVEGGGDYHSGLEMERRYYNGALTANGAGAVRTLLTCFDDPASGAGARCGVVGVDDKILPNACCYPLPQREMTWYVSPPAGVTSCTGTVACKEVFRSGYDATAREWGAETVRATSATMPGWTGRTTSRTWEPVTGGKWNLKLLKTVTKADAGTSLPGPTSVTTQFELNGAQNGFIDSAKVVEGTVAEGTERKIVRSFIQTSWYPTTETISVTDMDAGNPKLGGNTYTISRGFTDGYLTSRKWQQMTWNGYEVTRDPLTGVVWSSTDPAQNQTTYTYDVLGRLTGIQPPGELGTFITYGNAPSTATVIRCSDATCASGAAAWEHYVYDGFGRVVEEHRKLPGLAEAQERAVRVTRYNGAGLRSFVSEWVVKPADLATITTGTTFAYRDGTTVEPFGRPLKVTGPDNAVTLYDYSDPAAPYISDTYEQQTVKGIRGPNGLLLDAVTKRRSDILGRLLSVTDPESQVTTYTYNVLDKVATVAQGSQSRTFTYDAFGFLRSETHPEDGTTQYTKYDATGNVLGRKAAASATDPIDHTLTYDQAGRLLVASAKRGGKKVVTHTYVEQSYDAGGSGKGKLTWRRGSNPGAPRGTVVEALTETFTYDGPGGRLSKKVTSLENAPHPFVATETFRYNDLGLVSDHAYPRLSNDHYYVSTTEYRHGLPIRTFANGIPVIQTAAYHPSGALASYSCGPTPQRAAAPALTPITTTISRDAAGRPSSFTMSLGATPLLTLGAYGYDGAGNIGSIGTETYEYDKRSWLTKANLTGVGERTYAYDQYGNLTTKEGAVITPNAVNNQFAASWIPTSYDQDGRGLLTGVNGKTYAYDFIDRLATTDLGPGASYRHIYTATNERIQQVSKYDDRYVTLRDPGNHIIAQYLKTAAGSTYVPKRTNFYLGGTLVGSVGIDDPSGLSWQCYGTDHLGTPRLTVGRFGDVMSPSPRYAPYGDTLSPAQGQDLRFALMEQDTVDSSGSYYDHARTYEPVLGRFRTPDSLRGNPGDPHSWNRTTYAKNNPLKFVDPDGKLAVPVAIGVGAALVSAGVAAGVLNPNTGRQIMDAGRSLGGRLGQQVLMGVATAHLLTLMANSTNGGAKTGPKPAHTGPHNELVDAVGRGETAVGVKPGETVVAGGGVLPEQLIRTPGGTKEGRRPDVLIENDQDGSLRGVNIGKQDSKGNPIPREQKALDDLQDVGGIPMDFLPYNCQ